MEKTICISGDESGLLKFITLDSGENGGASVSSYGQQSRTESVQSLAWIERDKSFVALRSTGECQLWSCDKTSQSMQYMASCDTGLKNSGVTVVRVGDKNETLCCVGSNGDLSMMTHNLTGDVTKYKIHGPISACVTSPRMDIVSFGGRENDLKQFDVTTQQVSWTARNVPHDKLSLRVPVWITAITHFPESSDCDSLIATGTGYRHVRLYDTRNTDRRPTISFESNSEFRVTAIESVPSSTSLSVYVADTAGGLHLWDLRTQRKVVSLGGFAGSIRCLNIDRESGYIAGASLDR